MKWFVKCLRNYANFRGRASLPEFWYFVLFLFFVLLAVLLAVMIAMTLCPIGGGRRYIGLLAGVPFLLPYLAVAVRRLHDIGRSGWWMGGYLLVSIAGRAAGYASRNPDSAEWLLDANLALAILQFVYLIVMVYWLSKPGNPAANEYGAPPCSETGNCP